ncbi:helix-turn-helix domain-containing protein [Nocardia sp. NPDC050697]|uniref:helix-turn-helix domain-containing protein n=1 Tax=Nocardia sp. NPDC050697 TaxID=3155158 RepID=UPI0033E93275
MVVEASVGGAVGPFSVEQQERIWGGWRGGESLGLIAGVVGSTRPRVGQFLRASGGIRPVPRRRRAGHLSLGEREKISRGIAAGCSARVITQRIGRTASTVSRVALVANPSSGWSRIATAARSRIPEAPRRPGRAPAVPG